MPASTSPYAKSTETNYKENSLNGNTLIVGLPKNVDGAKRYILKILSDADEVQASYEQENNLGGDWGAAGTNDDDNNGWGNGW